MAGTAPTIHEWNTVSGDHYKQQKLYAHENNIVRLYDGTAVYLPYGAFAQDTVITVGILNSEGSSGGSNYQGVIREISIGAGNVSLGKNITIQIPYPDANNNGIVDGTSERETGLSIYWYDAGLSIWQKLPTSVVYSGENYVRAEVAHLSEFRIFGAAGPTTVEPDIWQLFE
jgi:hypothetical protein